ncbi:MULTISPECIES: ABC-type transport auxiliary lipoprotein family protein [unclassified Inquilinus]|uniref:ABC-type transport auxiliary lipoprotein family protein n=1 Tax=unclassified Inquilinus TaxID=2645927 RepID=UPI003F8EFB81
MTLPPLSRRLFLRQATLSSAAVGLAGCGGISALAPPAPSVYELTPKNTFDANLPKVTWQLLVDMPSANAGIDTDRIAISENPTSLDYFAKVAWVDRAPAMVVGLLVESFENTGKIISVGRQISGLRANYVLQPEIREFRAERWPGEPYRVRVRIGAKLVRFPQRTIIGGDSFERVMTVSGPDFSAVIQAWDDALGGVLKQIVEWALRTGEHDDRAGGRPRR